MEAMLALFAFLLLVLGFLFLPETYAPTILRSRARLLSKVTGKYYRANMDAKQELVVADLIKTSLVRPWILLFSEPIVLILSIYVAIVYGILFVSLCVLQSNRKLTLRSDTCCFRPILKSTSTPEAGHLVSVVSLSCL